MKRRHAKFLGAELVAVDGEVISAYLVFHSNRRVVRRWPRFVAAINHDNGTIAIDVRMPARLRGEVIESIVAQIEKECRQA